MRAVAAIEHIFQLECMYLLGARARGAARPNSDDDL